jgi:hypothetical protein
MTSSNLPPTTSNIMMKSVSSASGELDLSQSLSNSLALAAVQLKRTFCYAIIHAKTRTIIFYCFTTESANYDSIKLFLEQTSETIAQRYHLVNNTVLYKLGGLIGDNILNDLKKVRTTTLASCLQNSSSGDVNTTDPYNMSCLSESKVLNNPILSGPKLSKSPTVHRQMSYKEASTTNPINPSLVSNLQFLNNTNMPQSSLPFSTNIAQQIGSAPTSSLSQTPQQIPLSPLTIKQLYMNPFSHKPYDSTINIINQQINFCSLYLQ